MGEWMYRSIFSSLSPWRRVVSFTPWSLFQAERANGTNWIGDWVESINNLDDVEKRKFLLLLEHKLKPFHHPAQGQLLHTPFYHFNWLICYFYWFITVVLVEVADSECSI
jgi:hypothetical protein